eukprot:GHVR01192352.1.p1 GENE.GHVR01192352.1~~GHVR01192352.1.p1  ORF type:complete len:320 (+),score=53.11 GHVR01192352.1:69-1028(+)
MFELSDAPEDCITKVQYSPVKGDNKLLVSSWDGNLRLYDTDNRTLKAAHGAGSPVLDCAFLGDSRKAVFVGLSCELRSFNFSDYSTEHIGSHDKAIRCVEYHKQTGRVFTGGWDRVVKSWDLRSGHVAETVDVGGKVFCMHSCDDKLVVGTSARDCVILDARQLNRPVERRECLKHQMRTLKCFQDESGFAVASVEGRVAWESFSTNKLKYAFKCHRETENGIEKIFPVNALAFHPIYGTFATGGSDGLVCFWDGLVKKKISKMPKFPVGVSSLSFSEDGRHIAIATSYSFEEDEKTTPVPNQIHIKPITDGDIKNKTT